MVGLPDAGVFVSAFMFQSIFTFAPTSGVP